MRITALLLVGLACSACSSNHVDLAVLNGSDHPIDVRFSAGEIELGSIKDVPPRDGRHVVVPKVRPQQDGSYSVVVERPDTTIVGTYGYVTGGVPLAEQLLVTVTGDSVELRAQNRIDVR